MNINNIDKYGNILVRGNFIKTAFFEDEWFIDIDKPEDVIDNLVNCNINADFLTFWQRLPYIEPIFDFYKESDSIAVIPIDNYEYWWKKQISDKARNMARKPQKRGVEIRIVEFSDELVNGIVKIFNETPIRQGRKFLHYGNDFSQVKRELSDRLGNSEFVGAYFNGELIGFIKLLYTDRYAMIVLILSMMQHWDKSPTNGLVAKSVEICAEKGYKYLSYASWIDGGLGDFKRQNGFIKYNLPRYYVPLSTKGKLLLKFNLHHGIEAFIPEIIIIILKNIRKKLYNLKCKYILKNIFIMCSV